MSAGGLNAAATVKDGLMIGRGQRREEHAIHAMHLRKLEALEQRIEKGGDK